MINSWNFESKNFAIVLSGGGSKGAYQVGVLKYLREVDFLKQGPSYIGGVSVGSINAAALAQNNRSDFSLSIDNLEKFWIEEVVSNRDILDYRFPHYLSGLWKTSLGKSTKLEKIIDKRINIESIMKSDIALEVSAVNMNDGQIRSFNNYDPNLKKGIIASAAYPFAFPPVKIEGKFFIDGGVRDLAPLKRAINFGVDNIICIGTDHDNEELNKMKLNNIFDIGRNLVRICSANNFNNDVKKLLRINKQVTQSSKAKRKVIGIMMFSPSRPLGDTFDFSPSKNFYRIELGYNDAKNFFSNYCLMEKTN